MKNLNLEELKSVQGGHPLLVALAAGAVYAAASWAGEHFMDGFGDPCGEG